ncbi:hypothetical protein [Micromonospora sp. NPDC051141]|uniref:hypothetical protein n=1 Tax=Micromonospora sp. NPDC051141 TaxID=3364284 RepID=UPI003788281A
MFSARPHRGLIGLLGLTLGVTGLTVVTTDGAAVAAPHYTTPPQVQGGWVDSATPAKAYNWAEGVNMPLGTRVDDAGTSHTSRIYATFDLSQFEGGRKIYGGTVFIQEQTAADCTKRAIEIWRTKQVGSTPTWNRQPEPIGKLDEILTPEYCPRASISFDVGAAVQEAVAQKQRRITFLLRVPEQYESDPAYARELNWYKQVQLSVQYNSLPTVDNTRLYNGGFACTQLRPYPKIGSFAHVLQAVGSDADEWDQRNLRTDVAFWPVGHPEQRRELSGEHGISGRANTVQLPADALADGTSYVWQARVGDGADTSAWSKKCYFSYDATAPTAPTVTSSNYPSAETGQWVPAGEPGVFTFSGNGKKDVAGFQYGWGDLGVNVCEWSGDLGQLVCPDPLSYPGTVRADSPGGTATVTLSPNSAGPQRLTVRSIDLAGNVSTPVVYQVYVPSSAPQVETPDGPPEWNKDVLLRLTPAAGLTGVEEYEITLNNDPPETRRADEDGVAYFSFRATHPNGYRVTVRSRSANGFVSEERSWWAYFDPWPGVRSDVYGQPADGSPVGGVGVPGTFTFSPPPGWTDVATYRYAFGDDGEFTDVTADGDGRATVTWTPQTSGWITLTVFAVKADGTFSEYANWYSFEVAGTA